MTAATNPNDHALRMDRMYRYQRHIYDLTRKFYLLGRDRVIAEIAAKPDESILELGCGTGRNLALLARLYPQSRIFGLDISQEMLASARKTAPGALRLVAGDASAFSAQEFDAKGFDHILISYALSMIPRWEETIARAVIALNPGGTLHIVDFGQMERLPRGFQTIMNAWLRQFHVYPRHNMELVVQSLAIQRGAEWSFRSLFGGYAWSFDVHKPFVNHVV